MSCKTIAIELCGDSYDMPASYRVAADLCLLDIDPLQVALSARGAEDGLIPLSMEQIITIISVGVKRAGGSLTRDEVGEAIISDVGIIAALEVVSRYLTCIVVGGPSSEDANFKESGPGKPRRRTGKK